LSEATSTVRLPLVWAPLVRPIGVLIGATAARSWVEVGPEMVRISFGPLGKAEVPRSGILAVRRRHWPWWYGLGVRYYGRGAVGFVGRTRDVVEIELARPQRATAVVGRRVSRIAVSPRDAEQLMGLLQPGADGG
jgi:hypothetical protein